MPPPLPQVEGLAGERSRAAFLLQLGLRAIAAGNIGEWALAGGAAGWQGLPTRAAGLSLWDTLSLTHPHLPWLPAVPACCLPGADSARHRFQLCQEDLQQQLEASQQQVSSWAGPSVASHTWDAAHLCWPVFCLLRACLALLLGS
jgi:hypothetical protein